MSLPVRDLIKLIRDKSEKYGRLVDHETYTLGDIARIIAHYEEDGENIALVDADEKIAALHLVISKLHGAEGGRTARINKLQNEVAELQNVQGNNANLARITSYATELVEYLHESTYVDSVGDGIVDNPLLIRMVVELGIDSSDED